MTYNFNQTSAQSVRAHNISKWTKKALKSHIKGSFVIRYYNDEILINWGNEIAKFDPATKTIKPTLIKLTDEVKDRTLTLVKSHEALTMVKDHELN